MAEAGVGWGMPEAAGLAGLVVECHAVARDSCQEFPAGASRRAAEFNGVALALGCVEGKAWQHVGMACVISLPRLELLRPKQPILMSRNSAARSFAAASHPHSSAYRSWRLLHRSCTEAPLAPYRGQSAAGRPFRLRSAWPVPAATAASDFV